MREWFEYRKGEEVAEVEREREQNPPRVRVCEKVLVRHKMTVKISRREKISISPHFS
jgi:hypothetical protein